MQQEAKQKEDGNPLNILYMGILKTGGYLAGDYLFGTFTSSQKVSSRTQVRWRAAFDKVKDFVSLC